MSLKAKDLTFERQEPAFLKRMRAGQAVCSVDPDRHDRPQVRVRGKKTDDDDDAPTYVDEDGGTLSKEEYEALASANGELKKDEADAGDRKASADGKSKEVGDREDARPKQQISEVGASKKRKAIKVVGMEEDANAEPTPKSTKSKKPKKGKAVKLSFGDD